VWLGNWHLVYLCLSLLFGTCRDDCDDADNLLLFLSFNPVFMYVLTAQPSGQLHKQHKYKEVTSKKGEEERKSTAAPSVKRHS
jgi:hypothetical protein